uniref:transcription factor 12-like isoform X4 n=1 Tax=Myxine glutinosa TaxID=7769 RepID=UPI00358EDF96
MMSGSGQRIPPFCTDRELHDLLDFSAMFPTSLLKAKAVSRGEFSTSGGEETAREPWSVESQTAVNYTPGGCRPFHSERSVEACTTTTTTPTSYPPSNMECKEKGPYPMYGTESASGSCLQEGLLPTELNMADANTRSPTVEHSLPFYTYSAGSRRLRDPSTDVAEPLRKKSRKIPPGLSSPQVYGTSTSVGSDCSRESPGFQAKPAAAGMFPTPYYMQDGSHTSPDLWSSANGISQTGYGNGMLGTAATSHMTQAGAYGTMASHERLQGYPSPSPAEPCLGMQPGSGFARGSAAPPAYLSNTRTPPRNASEGILAARGVPTARSQTGDALGKALQSIYPSDHTSNGFSSSPSTPPSSSPPLSGSGQWSRQSARTPSSPSYDASLHSLKNRLMQELHRNLKDAVYTSRHPCKDRLDRLDDAIHILRSHAVGHGPGGLTTHGDVQTLLGAAHGGNVDQAGVFSGGSRGDGRSSGLVRPHCEDGLSMHGVLSGSLPSATSLELISGQDCFRAAMNSALQLVQSSVSSVDIKKEDEKDEKEMSRKSSRDDRRQDENKDEHKVMQRSRTSSSGDEDLPPEEREMKDRERRLANNARERIRVRDINEAFKELGRLCQTYLRTDKAPTKLAILQQAVHVITSLEQQVRERNLNPKVACLKQREDEKISGVPSDSSHDHMGSALGRM